MAGDVSVMQEFSEKVKEKIKRDFGTMIPEEAWDQLVKKAVEDFIQNDLGKIVKAELEAEVVKRLRNLFDSAEWRGQWESDAQGSGRVGMSEKVQEIISKNLDKIVEAVLGRAITGFLMEVSNRLR